jgi:hypothetical protein
MRLKRIEQSFVWAKTIGYLRKLPLIGLAKVNAWVHWNFAAYNLIRLGVSASGGIPRRRENAHERGGGIRTMQAL